VKREENASKAGIVATGLDTNCLREQGQVLIGLRPHTSIGSTARNGWGVVTTLHLIFVELAPT